MIDSDAGVATLSLLGPDEPPAVETVNADGSSSAVLVCDHASNRVPERLGTLGLDAVQLADHIGWDPGAADVARRLSARLDVPLVLSGYSRLVIDCNRPLRNAESIAEKSASVPVPGNHGLSPAERESCINALFRPYHDAIYRLLDGRSRRPSLLLSIHSFTPVLNGRPRPWHIGVSHGHQPDLAALMLGALARSGDFPVGDNEPYPIDDDVDYTIPEHGEGRGLPSAMIEIRQDGIRTAEGAAVWAERLAQAYRLIEAEALLSPLAVLRNYQKAFSDLGEVEEVYTCKGNDCFGNLGGIFTWRKSNQLPTIFKRSEVLYSFGYRDQIYWYGKVTSPESLYHVSVYSAINTADKVIGLGWPERTRNHPLIHLEVVEVADFKPALEVVTAEDMSAKIDQKGHIALYGIYFDFDSDQLKPESDPTLEEISKAFQADAALNIYVVGHTDNKGTLEYNEDLSKRRATAVVSKLSSKYGISSDRLVPVGVGPAAPVATNKSEEGRALNRRVELVER